MLIKFIKYQSVGNDFVLVDLEYNSGLQKKDYPKLATLICNRNFGVGSDGLIILSDSKMLFLNPDGTYDICGNGMRCVADYLYLKTNCISFTIETDYSNISANILDDSFIETIHPKVTRFNRITTSEVEGVLVYSGTPHFCIFDQVLDSILIEEQGRNLENSIDPSEPVNVDFIGANLDISQFDPLSVDIRIWERGVGQTVGCGTAAIAVSSVINSIYPNITNFQINSLGGILRCFIQDKHVSLIGKAQTVYNGQFKFLS